MPRVEHNPNSNPHVPVMPNSPASIPQATPTSAPQQTQPIVDASYITAQQLPSGFKAYPAGSVVKYRQYKWMEVKTLNRSNLSEEDRYALILSGIETLGFMKSQLTHPDVQYLGLMRRLATLGSSTFSIKYTCTNPRCRKPNTHNFANKDIEFQDLEVPSLPIIIALPGKPKIELMPLTLQAWLRLNRTNKNDDPIATMATMFHNIAEPEAIKILESIEDFEEGQLFDQADTQLFHGVKSMRTTCAHCEWINSIPLELISENILPFRTDESPKYSLSYGG